MLAHEPAMLNSGWGSDVHFRVDGRVFLFASLMAIVMMLLLALVPLAQAAHAELLPALQASATTRATGRTSIFRRTAIWLQIGISFALLVSTSALVRSFLNTRTQALGITRNQVLVAFTREPAAPKRDAVIANLNALPGVQRTAYAIRSPLMPSEGGIAAKVSLPDHPEFRDPVEIKYNAVSPDFLNLTGTHIVRGRDFIAADDRNGPPVIIVSQAMAHKYWGSRDPIGHVVRLPGFEHGQDLNARIVGIAEDAPINQIGETPEPYMYLPFHLSQMGEITFVVETHQNAMSVARGARQVLIHADPLLDPMFITSLPELIRFSSGTYQVMAELVTAMGALGLVLTVVGLYGFLAFRVTQRRREIGIRMALGASREATILLVVRETARMAVIGLAIGVVLALLSARIETAALFGVRPLDALSLVGALCILAIAIIGAAWLPARRAASVEPLEALRYE
jgi:predicted permease